MEDLEKIIGNSGVLFGSKGYYRYKNPHNVYVPNARILLNNKHIWKGDLDITKSLAGLKKYVKETNSIVVIFHESDWFFVEESPDLTKFLLVVDNFGVSWRKSYSKLLLKKTTTPVVKRVRQKPVKMKPVKYDEKDFTRVKIPLIFWKTLSFKQMNKKISDDHSVYWCGTDEVRFVSLFRSILIREGYRGYGLHKQVNSVYLSLPIPFSGKPKWAETGYLYLRKN